MTVDQVWAGADVGKEHHWVCVVDDDGAVVLSRKLINDEQQIRDLVAEIDGLAERVSWTVDLTTVYAALLLTVLADAGKTVRYLAGRAVWQASATYRGGEAKTDAKDARVMYMSALTATRCDPASKAYYQRKRDEGKRPIPATICLARRRTNVLYALIRDNRTWQPDSPPITESAA